MHGRLVGAGLGVVLLFVPVCAAGQVPTLFVHGHNEDGWTMWDKLLEKLPKKEKHFVDGTGYVPSKGDNPGCVASKSCSKDSYWLFDYYKNKDKCLTPTMGVLTNDQACRGKVGNPKDDAGGVVPRTALPGEAGVWGMGDTYNSVRSYSEGLQAAVDAVLAATGAEKVNIVAHSMGGLVSRSYVNWCGGGPKVYKLLMLGTPNWGASDVAEHVAQYGLIAYWEAFGTPVINEGSPPDPHWQRIGEDLEMYPKKQASFKFGNEAKPPPSILGPELPTYAGKTWIEWVNSVPLSSRIGLGRYATISGKYASQLVGIASGIIKVNVCLGWLASGCCDWFCIAKPGTCGCCGVSAACISLWNIINDMLQGRPLPDDGAVNVAEVQLANAAFNDVIVAVHGRMPEPFDKIPSEEILTECTHTADRIKSWLFAAEPVQCGDGACDTGEACDVCKVDCGACPPVCGDGNCGAGETCASCKDDCGACVAICGDGACSSASGENCKACQPDCSCPAGMTCTVDGKCCTKKCAGKECGDDGCGGECGGCVWIPEGPPATCKAGKCIPFEGQDYVGPGVDAGTAQNGGGDSEPYRYEFTPFEWKRPFGYHEAPAINTRADVLALEGYPLALSSLVPEVGPMASVPVEKEPSFFLQYPGKSNADEVLAVDYVVGGSGSPVAAILIEVTEGAPYTHDFATCSRFGGYRLDDVQLLQVDGAYYYGATLSKGLEARHGVSFAVTVDAEGQAVVDSAWINEGLELSGGPVVLNFQVWATNQQDALVLVSGILERLSEQTASMAYSNGTAGPEPDLFARSAVLHDDGVLELELHSRCRMESARVEELIWPDEGLGSSFVVEHEVVVPVGDQTVFIPHPHLASAVVYVTGEEADSFKDKVYVNATEDPCHPDPLEWWSYDDGATGGTSKVSVSVGDDVVSNPQKDVVLLEIPSLVHMEGQVTQDYEYGFVGCGISLSTCGQSADLSGAAGVSFMAKGDGKEYRLRLESAAVTDFDFHGFKFAAGQNWAHVDIPFSQLSQEGWGVAVDWTGDDLINVSFQTVGQPLPSVFLEVSDVVFYTSSGPKEQPLGVLGIVPYFGVSGLGTKITVIGANLASVEEVQVSNETLECSLTAGSYLACQVPAYMAPGEYDVNIKAPGADLVVPKGLVLVEADQDSLAADLCAPPGPIPSNPDEDGDVKEEPDCAANCGASEGSADAVSEATEETPGQEELDDDETDDSEEVFSNETAGSDLSTSADAGWVDLGGTGREDGVGPRPSGPDVAAGLSDQQGPDGGSPSGSRSGGCELLGGSPAPSKRTWVWLLVATVALLFWQGRQGRRRLGGANEPIR